MNKKPQRLTLSRETLRRLNEPTLRLAEGGVQVIALSEDPGCVSPLCMPTYWKGCEETAAG